MSKRAGTFISCAVGSGEKITKEEAKNACARPHSGIRLSFINKVDKDIMKGDIKIFPVGTTQATGVLTKALARNDFVRHCVHPCSK